MCTNFDVKCDVIEQQQESVALQKLVNLSKTPGPTDHPHCLPSYDDDIKHNEPQSPCVDVLTHILYYTYTVSRGSR